MEVTKLQLYSANQGKGLRFTTYIGSSAKVTYLTLGKKRGGGGGFFFFYFVFYYFILFFIFFLFLKIKY